MQRHKHFQQKKHTAGRKNHVPVGYGKIRHLCCGQENIVRYVAYTTGYHPQSHSGEDVGVVSLAGVEGATVRQHHLIKWTPAGKNAPALVAEEDTTVCVHGTTERNSCLILGLLSFTSVRV